MRQKADEGSPHLGQKPPSAPGKTSSEMSVSRMAFSLNQSTVVCLPLVSEGQRLVWVSSHEINLQLDGAATLSEAFDRFPYLTQTQTAALAQRCSLHPDQVKVWFMAQRLRYGISWDYKDIPNVRMKMAGGGEEEPRKRKGPEVKEDGGKNKKGKKKAGEVREEQGAREGRMMGENASGAEKMEMEPEHPRKKDIKEEEEDDKRNQKKRKKRITLKDTLGKKRVKQEGEEGVAEGVEERSDGAEEEATNIARLKKKTQVAMMKTAFTNCQYPDVKDYDRLAKVIDIPRYTLVQWFGDMRYYVKKFQPRWLTQEQYSQALANIRYRQYLAELVKLPHGTGEDEKPLPPPVEKRFSNL